MNPIEVLEKAYKEVKEKVRYNTSRIKMMQEDLITAQAELEDNQLKAQELAAAIIALRASQ